MRVFFCRRLPFAIVVMCALAACAESPDMAGGRGETPSEQSLVGPLPVYPHEDIPSALLAGTVTVIDEPGRKCVALESSGRRYGALWPAGFELRADPYRVVDAEGRVVAREGETIEFGGGEIPPQSWPNPCRTPTLFLVGELDV